MKIEVLMSKLFGYSPQTYFNWKKEEAKRPIISLLKQYFDKKDLEGYLSTGKIKKLEDELEKTQKHNFIELYLFEKNRIKYLESFTTKNPYTSLDRSYTLFSDFYMGFLLFLKKEDNFYEQNFQHLLNQYLLNYSIIQYQSMLDSGFDTEYKESVDLYQESGFKEYTKEAQKHVHDTFRSGILETYENLYKHFSIFEGWDSYMLLFLKECLDSDFNILFSKNDNKKLQDEALYHIELYKKKVVN